MKIRVQRHAIRFRLSQSEVATLRTGATLEEAVPFAPAPLAFRLGGSAATEASFSAGVVHVALPAAWIRTWADTDQVGMQETVSPAGQPVTILVEKDFRCLHPGDPADNVDTFPNPLEA